MKRVALINQRYGIEVNGGSEYYTRLIAEKLTQYYEVDVLTSKAFSYENWSNYYNSDIEDINGVTVRRFRVETKRKVLLMRMLSYIIRNIHINNIGISNLWVKCQGPYVPDLIKYIENNKDMYDIFFFVTYLYYPTVMGMEIVRDRAVFIPTAHDEPYILYQSYKKLFAIPRAIIYLTDEERKFVQALFHNENIPSIVAGVGVDVPGDIDHDRFRNKYNIEGDYLIYVGRVDASKGCKEMFDMLHQYCRQRHNITLIIMGQKFIDIPECEEIRYLGFVSEEDKFDGISGAKALWMPSQYESLSIVVLEAMALSIPVLVNGNCQVLKGHCDKSRGGIYYDDQQSLNVALDILLNDKEKSELMGKNAIQYVRNKYSWDAVMQSIVGLTENILINEEK